MDSHVHDLLRLRALHCRECLSHHDTSSPERNLLAWNVVLSDEPTRLMSLASTHDEGNNAHVHFEMKPAASSSDSAYFTVRSQCCRTREGECVVCTVTRCTSTGGAICHAYAQQRTPTLVRSNKHILLPIVSSIEEEDTQKKDLCE